MSLGVAAAQRCKRGSQRGVCRRTKASRSSCVLFIPDTADAGFVSLSRARERERVRAALEEHATSSSVALKQVACHSAVTEERVGEREGECVSLLSLKSALALPVAKVTEAIAALSAKVPELSLINILINIFT